MVRVLVTGATGFVGSHLLEELSTNNIEAMPIGGTKDKNKTGLHLNLMHREDLSVIDLSNIDTVIHLAGLAAVGPSFDNPMKYIQTNMGIEINLFEEAIRQKTRLRFIIVSSGSLYSPDAKLPLSEESSVSPNSPYAVSKLGQEQLAAYYSSRGFECIIARPFNHIGPGQGPGFIAPDLAASILKAKRLGLTEISVGNLESRRDYTDVRDIVRAYRLLAEHGRPGKTYNICTGRSLSGKEILEGLMQAANVKLKTVIDPNKKRPSDVKDIYGSYEKLNKDTGWEPTIPIAQTLRDIVAST